MGKKTSVELVQGEDYWRKRPATDKKKDWNFDGSWLSGYIDSIDHPHRDLITDVIGKLPSRSLLEVGCSIGPNLILCNALFKGMKLAGIDVSEVSIKHAKGLKYSFDLKVASVMDIPFDDDEFDVVLADAVLMYVPPDDIEYAISEMSRVAKKAIVVVDWHDRSRLGVVKNYHWARNYERLLTDQGFKVKKIKITKKEWPTKTWAKNGYAYIAQYPQASQTSKKS